MKSNSGIQFLILSTIVLFYSTTSTSALNCRCDDGTECKSGACEAMRSWYGPEHCELFYDPTVNGERPWGGCNLTNFRCDIVSENQAVEVTYKDGKMSSFGGCCNEDQCNGPVMESKLDQFKNASCHVLSNAGDASTAAPDSFACHCDPDDMVALFDISVERGVKWFSSALGNGGNLTNPSDVFDTSARLRRRMSSFCTNNMCNVHTMIEAGITAPSNGFGVCAHYVKADSGKSIRGCTFAPNSNAERDSAPSMSLFPRHPVAGTYDVRVGVNTSQMYSFIFECRSNMCNERQFYENVISQCLPGVEAPVSSNTVGSAPSVGVAPEGPMPAEPGLVNGTATTPLFELGPSPMETTAAVMGNGSMPGMPEIPLPPVSPASTNATGVSGGSVPAGMPEQPLSPVSPTAANGTGGSVPPVMPELPLSPVSPTAANGTGGSVPAGIPELSPSPVAPTTANGTVGAGESVPGMAETPLSPVVPTPSSGTVGGNESMPAGMPEMPMSPVPPTSSNVTGVSGESMPGMPAEAPLSPVAPTPSNSTGGVVNGWPFEFGGETTTVAIGNGTNVAAVGNESMTGQHGQEGVVPPLEVTTANAAGLSSEAATTGVSAEVPVNVTETPGKARQPSETTTPSGSAFTPQVSWIVCFIPVVILSTFQ